MKRFVWLAAAALPLLLAACSDDDDGTPPPPITQQVPGGAGATPQAFMDAVQQIVAAANADTLEPSDISLVANSNTTTDDTSEPQSSF